MGIVNRTPDSFYDGGRMGLEDVVSYARMLVAEGADIIDLGAVKAGPGPDVDEAEELARLLPALDRLVSELGTPVSIETTRASVARAALGHGAAMVNYVGGTEAAGIAAAVAEAGASLIVMHNGGQVRGRPRHPRYEDVVAEVGEYLHSRAEAAAGAGVAPELIWVDPGIDFGKTTFHSLELTRRLGEIVALGYPVLYAASRKDVIGESLDLDAGERLEGSLALAALAVASGARAVRVHDVAATVRVVGMVEAVYGRRPPLAPVRGLWD